MSVEKIRVVETLGKDPYRNLALEEILLGLTAPSELILFLWQNEHTIVIGKNQNPWQECKVQEFLADGGWIARRMTGGGAVYHDVGNLNFSFAAGPGAYNVQRQLQVIVRAVRRFGIEAEVSGRNDVTAGGRKFSGNAFLEHGERKLHHGTLLVRGDVLKMQKYLTPDAEKLKKRSVDSVSSRVVNLADLCPAISIKALKEALVLALYEEYGVKPDASGNISLPEEEFRKLRERNASQAFLFGEEKGYSKFYRRTSEEGTMTIAVSFEEASPGNSKKTIRDVCVWTDAMDPDSAARMRETLLGIPEEELAALGFCPFA